MSSPHFTSRFKIGLSLKSDCNYKKNEVIDCESDKFDKIMVSNLVARWSAYPTYAARPFMFLILKSILSFSCLGYDNILEVATRIDSFLFILDTFNNYGNDKY